MNQAYIAARKALAVDHERPEPLPAQVLAIRCPHCGVGPGAHCVRRSTEVRLRHSQAHPARFKAANVEVPGPRVPAGLLSREQPRPGTPGTPDVSVAANEREAMAS